MKRFYKEVTSVEEGGLYGILLDGKPLKTPSGTLLSVGNERLAEALAAEWRAQEEDIDPDTMPLMQILSTARDRVAQERAAMTPQVLAYLDTDLLCYPAPEPADLVAMQEEHWAPWREWFAQNYAVPLVTTTGLTALAQDKVAHDAVAEKMAALDDDFFTILQLVTALSGSLVLALAFLERAITPEKMFDTIHVEERYKARLYHEDIHGAAPLEEKKQTAFRRDIKAARQFLDCLS